MFSILRIFIATLVLLAHVITADEFRIVIYTPKFSHFRVLGLNPDWTLDVTTKEEWAAREEYSVTKLKGGKNVITGALSWERGKVPEARPFWIDNKDAVNATSWREGLMRVSSVSTCMLTSQCVLDLKHELKKDVWVYLGEWNTRAWHDPEDTLEDGWLHCGDGEEFDTTMFSFPEPWTE
jgi:hypothetical protein